MYMYLTWVWPPNVGEILDKIFLNEWLQKIANWFKYSYFLFSFYYHHFKELMLVHHSSENSYGVPIVDEIQNCLCVCAVKDREAWGAVVHGVAKHHTGLSDWTTANQSDPQWF